MKSTLKALTVATLLTGAVIAAPLANAAQKIGVVDFMQVFQQAPQGNASLQKLKDALKPQLAGLKSEQQKIADNLKTYERNQATMSKDDRKKQEADIAKQQDAFQKKIATLRQGEVTKEKAAAQTFEAALKGAIDKVAKAKGYDLELRAQGARNIAYISLAFMGKHMAYQYEKL